MALKKPLLLLLIPTGLLAFTQDGGWSAWSKLQTPCIKSPSNQTLVSCGGGVRIRYRSCTMPVPQGDGSFCQGQDTKYDKCNEHPCQLPPEYLWSEWSKCSKVCGRGIRKRYTMCGNVRRKPMTSLVSDTVDTTEGSVTTTDESVTEVTTTESVTDTTNTSDENFVDPREHEVEYEEQCHSNQYKEEREACNTWNPIHCPNPCDNVRCPAFAKCKNISTDTDPLFRCDCQLGTVKKEDGSACIAPQPQKVTVRPIPAISDTEKTAILLISRGGSTILIIFLIITMLVFAIARIWTISRIIHFNMEFSLLLAHLCLLPVGIYENHPEMCKIVSTLIHFFFLACFTFMFLEAIHLYALVGWVVKSDGIMSRGQNILMGWLIPMIIVMFNLCFEYDNYGGEYHCWLQMNTSLIYGQFVPIAFMTVTSLAIIEAAGNAEEYKKLENVNEAERKNAKVMQRTLILILPLVFATFLLGTLAEYDQNLVLYSIWTLFNGILGGLIFIFHCSTNEVTRAKLTALKKLICRK